MKNAAIAIVLTVAGLVSTSAVAQANFIMRANVPFAFTVDGHQYAAGFYALQAKNTNGFVLRNQKTGQAAMVPMLTRRDGKNTEAVLHFAVNGGRAILATISDAEGHTWKVPVSRSEMEVVKNPESKAIEVALK